MGLQELLEEDRGAGERAHGADLQGGPAVEGEHEFTHGDGQLADLPVGAAIGRERAGVNRFGERVRLAEGDREAFAGDGVG